MVLLTLAKKDGAPTPVYSLALTSPKFSTVTHSPKFPTVVLQQSMSPASLYWGGGGALRHFVLFLPNISSHSHYKLSIADPNPNTGFSVSNRTARDLLITA